MTLHFGNTSVDETQDFVTIFPNPTKDKVLIQASDIQSVQLFNTMGQCLYSENFGHATQIELDLSTYSAGMFNLVVHHGNGYVTNKKIIKQ